MIINQIPKQVLIHTVTYEEFVQGDGFETEDGFKTPVTLRNVLLQPSNTSSPNIVRNANSELLAYNYTMFYDVINSSSDSAFEFKEKSKINFDGKTLVVEKVSPVYGFRLHHYEIGLI